ncbi:hypothetical protein AtNW77_Chr1g0039391 [Arabidopsis thaliana]
MTCCYFFASFLCSMCSMRACVFHFLVLCLLVLISCLVVWFLLASCFLGSMRACVCFIL